MESQTIGLTPQELANAIVAKTNNPNLQVLIYIMCYIKTFNKDKFYGYNNNFANVELSVYWGPSTQYFIQKRASCVLISNSNGTYDNTTASTPIANFESLDKFLDFMVARLTPNINRILFGESGNAPLGIPKYYSCFWTPATSENPNISTEYYDDNQNEFKLLINTVKKAIASAKSVQLNGDATNSVQSANKAQEQQIINGGNNPTNNINTTTLPPPVCNPPTIKSFSPTTGVTGTILSLFGNDFDSVTAVTVNGVTVTTGITINSSTNMIVIVPKSNTSVPQNNTISVYGVHGSGTTTNTFTYNPLQVSAAPPTIAPNVPPNANTQPQQTGPLPLIGVVQNGLYSLSQASINVSVNPVLSASYTMLPTLLPPELTFKVTQQNVSNNVNQTYTVYESEGIDLGLTYFTSSSSFNMAQNDIITVITNNWQTPPPNSKIICEFAFNAEPILVAAVPPQQVYQFFKLEISI